MLLFQLKTLIRCVIHFILDVRAALGLLNFLEQHVFFFNGICYTCEVNNLYHDGTSSDLQTLKSITLQRESISSPNSAALYSFCMENREHFSFFVLYKWRNVNEECIAFFPNTFSIFTLLFFSFPLSFLPAHSMLVSLKKCWNWKKPCPRRLSIPTWLNLGTLNAFM